MTEAALADLGWVAEANASPTAVVPRRIIRSNRVVPKSMAVEEALLQVDEQSRDQVTYRDAQSGELRVLLRRRDDSLELIEAS